MPNTGLSTIVKNKVWEHIKPDEVKLGEFTF